MIYKFIFNLFKSNFNNKLINIISFKLNNKVKIINISFNLLTYKYKYYSIKLNYNNKIINKKQFKLIYKAKIYNIDFKIIYNK